MQSETKPAFGGRSSFLLILLVTAVMVGAGGFLAGMKYQQSKQPSRPDFQAMRGSRQALPGAPTAETEMVRGEIISQDEESITVKLPDDSTKIILILDDTKIDKATEGSTDDLKSGEQVMIFGKQNSDGSISATQIQLNFGLRGTEQF